MAQIARRRWTIEDSIPGRDLCRLENPGAERCDDWVLPVHSLRCSSAEINPCLLATARMKAAAARPAPSMPAGMDSSAAPVVPAPPVAPGCVPRAGSAVAAAPDSAAAARATATGATAVPTAAAGIATTAAPATTRRTSTRRARAARSNPASTAWFAAPMCAGCRAAPAPATTGADRRLGHYLQVASPSSTAGCRTQATR